MIIPRILHFCCTSVPSRVKLVGNAADKRLFLKNTNKFIAVKNYSAYAGDGKTIGVILNKKRGNVFLINKLMADGFTLPSGSQFIGPMIIFPHLLMSWNVSDAKNVTEESLILFKLIEPKIDILVFGYGNRRDFTPEVHENFKKCCKSLGLRFEALPTDKAVGTYNFLADERRLVAGAFIPPKYIDVMKFDRKKPVYLEEEEEEEKLRTIPGGQDSKKMLK